MILGAFFVTTDAAADPHFDGRWKQGALTESFTVQTWINACGEAPKTSTTGGGEIVNIRLEGDELTIVGGGRVYRTNTCYDPMPTLARESHSRDPNGKTWRTRCTTPPNDPRKAILNTLVAATTDTHIDLRETGRYEIVLKEGTCIADVSRTRSFDLVADDKPAISASAAPAPAPTKEQPKPNVCTSVGDPQRLEVRPSKKLMRPGESFAFRAVVLDEKGCATRTPTTWKLADGAEGKGMTVDATGNVSVADDAPEGTVDIVATAAGKDTRVSVEISSAAHYDDLLARSGLNASGESDNASTAILGGASLGAGEGTVEDHASKRRYGFLAVIGGLLVVLGIVAVAVMKRSKRAKELEHEIEERHEARVQEALDRKREREQKHAEQQKAHEASLAALEQAKESQKKLAAALAAQQAAKAAAATPLAPPVTPNVPAAAPAAPAKEMRCPQCGRTQKWPTSFCPHDGVKLVESGAGDVTPAVAALAVATPQKRGKICPTCGDRFGAETEYCGKDGTYLVLIN